VRDDAKNSIEHDGLRQLANLFYADGEICARDWQK
jgi:hypothetical protein